MEARYCGVAAAADAASPADRVQSDENVRVAPIGGGSVGCAEKCIKQ